MNLNYFSEQSKLPLVVSPAAGESGKNNLINWISANKVTIEEQLIESGAVLFKGFDIQTPQDFEDVAKAVDNDLKDDYMGTSPRDKKSGFV
ncbi:MAG: TauD/TfdA family dioxygenase, partial [Chitinophagales bacterium]|nr:TauD/TfdA family dioxygenase [Chitinophagales bacterium]